MKEEQVLFSKGIFEFVENETEYNIGEDSKKVKRQFVRRPPGVRALIVNSENKILLSKEFRYEVNGWDYRLPGGKVFDDLQSFKEALNNGNIDDCAYKTVFKEVLEEVGLEIESPKLLKISKDGVTVSWDLYYYEIKNFKVSAKGTALEEDEFVSGYDWYSYEDIVKMCKNNEIHEDRTVGVLLTYILNNKQEN